MKITQVECLPIRVNVDRKVGTVQDAKGFRFQSSILLVFIRTDEGLEGLGEINGSPDWSGETCLGAREIVLRQWAPRLIGEDPTAIRHCLSRLNRTYGNPFARAGIEMALFDLLGKSLNVPVYQLLGGPVRNLDLPIRFPVMPVGPAESAEAALRMVSEGFRTVKLKVGHDPLPYDMERVVRVREAVGSDVQITVDANGGWTVNEAIRAADQLEACHVSFVEQPVHRSDLAGMATVRRRIRLPIMADESIFTPAEALACFQMEAADILSVYPGKNGGILNTVTMVSMAEAAGVRCAIGSNLEWDIASAAMAHLAVALPNIAVEHYATDIIGPLFHVEHATTVPFAVHSGKVTCPGGPGLGIELDRDRLKSLIWNP